MPAPAHLSERGWPTVWIVQEPKTDVILPAINYRHERQNDIVECAGNHRSENIAAGEPGKKDRGHGFEADNWNEAKKNANRDAARNRFRGVANRQQLQ